MNDQENPNQASVPEKEDFYSHLDMKDIPDVDYTHTNEFVKILK